MMTLIASSITLSLPSGAGDSNPAPALLTVLTPHKPQMSWHPKTCAPTTGLSANRQHSHEGRATPAPSPVAAVALSVRPHDIRRTCRFNTFNQGGTQTRIYGISLGSWIRTNDPLLPRQVRHLPAPYPDYLFFNQWNTSCILHAHHNDIPNIPMAIKTVFITSILPHPILPCQYISVICP